MAKLSFTNDYYFYTIQGEGLHTGVPSIFMRLSGCNLRCEWKNPDGSTSLCDTPYSSHEPEKLIKTVEEVVKDIEPMDCKYVVITGGEPFLQKNMAVLVSELKARNYYICIETNGSLYFENKADFMSISPKLSTSCVDSSKNFESHNKKRLDQAAILSLCKNHDFQLKFVVNSEVEMKEINELRIFLEENGVSGVKDKILLMPQAVTEEQLVAASLPLLELCKKYDYRFCDRLHIRIWNDKRGV